VTDIADRRPSGDGPATPGGGRGERRRTPRRDTLWEQVRDKVRELQDRAHAEAERRRVNEVLGRPVRRTVVDADGRLILDVGAPVTRDAVARADRGGVLELLLEAADRNARPPGITEGEREP
jgi:hypothetical protein